MGAEVRQPVGITEDLWMVGCVPIQKTTLKKKMFIFKIYLYFNWRLKLLYDVVVVFAIHLSLNRSAVGVHVFPS